MSSLESESRRILVIRHGALGDFVQSLGAFAAIRAFHPHHQIVLLTSPFLHDFAKSSPYFDEVWVDRRPRWTHLPELVGTLVAIHRGGFERIYDLQTSDRSAAYFRLLRFMGRMPLWSGHVKGCAFPHTDRQRTRLHNLDRQRDQLRIAGITDVPAPDLSWVEGALKPSWNIKSPYALIVAQASLHRQMKFYPIAHFRQLICQLVDQNVTPVFIGSLPDRGMDFGLSSAVSAVVRDLRGETTLRDLPILGRHALFALGNDTGPMHIFAISGCPSIGLFSKASDPSLCAFRGANVTILRHDTFATLTPEIVWESIVPLLKGLPSREPEAGLTHH